jgi:hypothetical protein
VLATVERPRGPELAFNAAIHGADRLNGPRPAGDNTPERLDNARESDACPPATPYAERACIDYGKSATGNHPDGVSTGR